MHRAMVPIYKKIKTEEGRSRQRQEMRGFMPIEAVAEAEAENEGRKREQSSSKNNTDSFHHRGFPITLGFVPSRTVIF